MQGLKDTSVDKGAQLVLKCTLSGSQPMNVKWYKDGQLLRSANKVVLTQSDDGTVQLTIDQAGIRYAAVS